MFDKLIWPISLGLMFLFVTLKGGSVSEMIINFSIGALVGSVVSFGLLKIFHKAHNRLRANFVIATLWGVLIFAMFYPNLKVPHQPLNKSTVSFLVLFSLGPLIAVIVKWLKKD